MENITRLCDKISNSSADDLKNCTETKHECITYSRNGRYSFRCYETDTSQERGELPLCEDTEDITVSLAVTDVPYSIDPEDEKTRQAKSLNVISAAEIHSCIPLLTVILLSLQLWDLFYCVGWYVIILNYYINSNLTNTTCEIKWFKQLSLSFTFIWSRAYWVFVCVFVWKLHYFWKDSYICTLLLYNEIPQIIYM